MLNKLQNMDFSQARYALLKEVDTRGEICRFISDREFMFTTIMCDITYLADRYLNTMLSPDEVTTISDDTFQVLMNVAEKAPSWSIRLPADWNEFISAFIVIVDTYLKLENDLSDLLDEGSKEKQREKNRINSIREALAGLMAFIQQGALHRDLIQATTEVLIELKGWQNIRPTPLKLSEAYLHSLNYYKE